MGWFDETKRRRGLARLRSYRRGKTGMPVHDDASPRFRCDENGSRRHPLDQRGFQCETWGAGAVEAKDSGIGLVMRWQDMPSSMGSIEAGDIGPAARDAAAGSLDPKEHYNAVMARMAQLQQPLTPEQHAWTQANLPRSLPLGPLEDPAQAQNFDPSIWARVKAAPSFWSGQPYAPGQQSQLPGMTLNSLPQFQPQPQNGGFQ